MFLNNYAKNMDTKEYKIIITPTAQREMIKIYEYIMDELYNIKASYNLMNLVEDAILELKFQPYVYAKIEKIDELDREYRRITIKNYVILYTIDETENVVYIAHMYYIRKNYLD